MVWATGRVRVVQHGALAFLVVLRFAALILFLFGVANRFQGFVSVGRFCRSLYTTQTADWWFQTRLEGGRA